MDERSKTEIKIIKAGKLKVGDELVNFGKIVEINEASKKYLQVIYEVGGQRNVEYLFEDAEVFIS